MTLHPPIKIMLLDDEPFMLRLLVRMLSRLGFTDLMACHNGADALALATTPGSVPDLILCDLNMPGMDGVEFLRKLVEHHYAGSLVLVSGEDERILQTAGKLVEAHELTMLGHLTKPVSLEALEGLLEKFFWLAQQAPLLTKPLYSAPALRQAIANGELQNYYQPKVSVATGRVVGVEALVRWNHPQDGLILPEQFISVAEDHDVIDAVTRVVLLAALDQSKRWRHAGLALQVAVNISMHNLHSLDFPDFIASCVADAGMAPQDVILEITESRLMNDPRVPLDILTRLRLKRFRLSIDDFGTENSSLTRLCDIPFNELKVDRSFVHGAWKDDTLHAIYNVSLDLTRQLGMELVAEGVEDRQDWDFLQQKNCYLAQGYFIAKPMPADQIPAWMEEWRDRLQEQQLLPAEALLSLQEK